MNQFRISSLPLWICFMLMTQQAFYIAAFGESNSLAQPEILSFSVPKTIGTPTEINLLRKNEQLVREKDRFLPGTMLYASKIGSDAARRLAEEGVFIGTSSKNNYIDLANGNILINPEKDTIVGTKAGNIFIGAQAIVFIMESGNDVVLYDLFQTKPKQVAVLIGTKLILQPGRMLVLTRQNTDDFEKLELNCHSITYSGAKLLNLYSHHDAGKAFIADFSIASALVTIQPLKQLIDSNNKQDNTLLAKLVKSSVIIGNFDAGVIPQSEKFVSTAQNQ